MSDKDISALLKLVKQQLKEPVTRKSAMEALIRADIVNKDGDFTKQYSSLSKLYKKV